MLVRSIIQLFSALGDTSWSLMRRVDRVSVLQGILKVACTVQGKRHCFKLGSLQEPPGWQKRTR